MLKTILIALGAAIGALARHGMTQNLSAKNFPFATLWINLLGCFLMGIAVTLCKNTPNAKFLFIVGILGSFTTYSAFSFESLQMMQRADWSKFLVYVGAHVIGGLWLIYWGGRLAQWFR